MDVIKTADYIIDLGPEGGDEGGYVIGCGTPEEILKIKNSYTGQFLEKMCSNTNRS
jgi:excinuclease ABC subunit A